MGKEMGRAGNTRAWAVGFQMGRLAAKRAHGAGVKAALKGMAYARVVRHREKYCVRAREGHAVTRSALRPFRPHPHGPWPVAQGLWRITQRAYLSKATYALLAAAAPAALAALEAVAALRAALCESAAAVVWVGGGGDVCVCVRGGGGGGEGGDAEHGGASHVVVCVRGSVWGAVGGPWSCT